MKITIYLIASIFLAIATHHNVTLTSQSSTYPNPFWQQELKIIKQGFQYGIKYEFFGPFAKLLPKEMSNKEFFRVFGLPLIGGFSLLGLIEWYKLKYIPKEEVAQNQDNIVQKNHFQFVTNSPISTISIIAAVGAIAYIAYHKYSSQENPAIADNNEQI